MSGFSKILREVARVFSPMHWIRNAKLLMPVLASKILGPTDYEDVSDLFKKSAPKSDLCAFILYSPDGLRTDTKQLIETFIAQPKSVLAILSKAPLKQDDKRYFEARGIPYREQKNTGYDFGSYRDFCMSLIESGYEASSLTLVNDSFLFLAQLDSDPVSRVRAHTKETGFSGLISQGRKRPKDFHACSFLLSFSGGLLQSDAFKSFWRLYRPSNNRDFTIKLGEIGLSQALIKSGAFPQFPYDRERLIAALETAETQTLDILAEGLKLSDVFSAIDYGRFCEAPRSEKRHILQGKIQYTENLRLAPAYNLLCHMPILKFRNVRVYPGLDKWYEKHFGVNL